jgi:hypothetical protein
VTLRCELDIDDALEQPKKLALARSQTQVLISRISDARELAKIYPPPDPSIYSLITSNSRHIPAKDRLFHCPPLPGCPVEEPDTSTVFSEETIRKRTVLLTNLTPSYLEGIGYALKDYHTWCALNDVPDRERMPMRKIHLELYLSSLAGYVAAKTLQGRVMNLQRWHQHCKVEWTIKKRDYELVLRGAKMVEPYKKVKRPPFLRTHLEECIKRLDSTNSFDVCWKAATTIAHRACLRSGEFTLPSQSAFRPDWHVTRNNLKVTKVDGVVVGITLHLPKDKVKGLEGADVHFGPIVDSSTCPVDALFHHLSDNRIEDGVPLFTYTSSKPGTVGQRLAMSKKAWRKRLDELLTEAGLPTMQGHTVRIGGATQLLLDGVEPLVVKVMGRWSSDAFQTYWRNVGAILAKFAASATVRTALVEEQSLSNEDLRKELRAVRFSSTLTSPFPSVLSSVGVWRCRS